MLAPAQRLRRRDEFAAALRAGRRTRRGALVIHVSTTVEPSPPADSATAVHGARAGFIVSKAVGGAVERNRVRRRLRHLTRERLGTLPPGTSIVVRALPDAAGRPYSQLGADLDAAMRAATTSPRSDRT